MGSLRACGGSEVFFIKEVMVLLLSDHRGGFIVAKIPYPLIPEGSGALLNVSPKTKKNIECLCRCK